MEIPSNQKIEEEILSNETIEEIGVPINTLEKTFHLRGKFIGLTYKSWIKKIEFTNFIKEIGSRWKVENCYVSHETGNSKGVPYLHSHVGIEFNRPIDTTNKKLFDFEHIHPNIKFLKGVKAWKSWLKYISKEDETALPEKIKKELGEKKGLATLIFREKDVISAINNNAETFSEIPGIMALYALKNRPLTRFNWNPTSDFHNFIVDLNNITPDGRTIYWFYDKIGNKGKTQLGKWLRINYENKWYMTKDMGTSRDCATIISNAIAGGWEGWGLILDLPRTAQNHDRMYEYIETICDGVVTTQKYNGKTIDFDAPHVCVFANWLPKIKSLSRDRWYIQEINPDGTLIKLDLKTVFTKRKEAEETSEDEE